MFGLGIANGSRPALAGLEAVVQEDAIRCIVVIKGAGAANFSNGGPT
jgi:hypothetical protein